MTGAECERWLRAALAGTHETPPRRMADLEWPGLAQKALQPMMALMKPAAVLVPIVRRGDGHTVLLTRRADTLRNHKGQVSFPGGRRDETDASLAACALREAQEEVGLPTTSAEVIGFLDDYPTFTRYRVTPVVALVDPPAQFISDPGEVAEIFEIPLALALDENAYAYKMLSREGMKVPFFELEHERHRIWGATAGMLRSLMRKLRQPMD